MRKSARRSVKYVFSMLISTTGASTAVSLETVHQKSIPPFFA